MALFGHGRDSQPVVNPKDKVLMVGGKPLLGLDRPHHRTTTTTTTLPPTTTPEPTTTEWAIEESTTLPPYPTCPPGTFSKIDEFGFPVLDPEGILDCYPEGECLRKTQKLEITSETWQGTFLRLFKTEICVTGMKQNMPTPPGCSISS